MKRTDFGQTGTIRRKWFCDALNLSVPRRGFTSQPRVATQDRTLGNKARGNPTLKGLHARVIDVEPLQGSLTRGSLTQGARPAVATLGCDV